METPQVPEILSSPAVGFDGIDTNGDGVIDRAEWEAAQDRQGGDAFSAGLCHLPSMQSIEGQHHDW